MPRPQIPDKTRIVVAGDAQIAAFLDLLTKTGLYGATRAEAAKRLITDGIKQLIEEQFFSKLESELETQRTRKREGGRVRGGQR